MPQKVKKCSKKSLPRIKAPKVEETESGSEEDATESVESSPAVENKDEKFSLYVRATAAWLKDRDNAPARLKEIDSKIQDVRYPRQKHADFCFIDFATASERDQSYKELKSRSDIYVSRVTKDKPRILKKRQQKVAEKREARKETRKLIRQIKKKEKFNASQTERSNQVVIVNLPPQVTVTELKQQYPSAVKVIVKQNPKAKNRMTSIITFPDPKSALTASRESILLHGQKINVMLNTDASFKNTKKSKENENQLRDKNQKSHKTKNQKLKQIKCCH